MSDPLGFGPRANVIVPLTAGVGDLEDELYSLNESGKDVWRLLDGRTWDEFPDGAS